ncbi:MAG: FtsX-like permease family protein [bacterium]|nr:FtsX-like permease family protein [bacterium]
MRHKIRKPPRFAAWLIKRLTMYNRSHCINGDIEELYYEMYRDKGYIAAVFWYLLQTIIVLVQYFNLTTYRGIIMFKSYLKIAFRNIRRQKVFSLINISGLAIGIAAGIIMMLYVYSEISYDRFHEKSDRIHRITMNIHVPDRIDTALFIGPIMAKTLMDDYPEVELAVKLRQFTAIVSHDGRSFKEENAYASDPNFFKVFSFPLIKGDKETALNNPNSIILTESTARKYFGDDDPMDRDIIINKQPYTVVGIAEDVPENSHFHFDFLASINSFERNKSIKWLDGFAIIYVLLNKGTDPAVLEAKFPALVKKYLYDEGVGGGFFKNWEFFLQPLTDIHLHSEIDIGEFEVNGNATYVYIFLVLAVFILVIACVNFINLTTARSVNRAREVGVRKVVGSMRSQLIRQFLGESLFTSLISMLLALVLIYSALPFFRGLAGKQLEIDLLQNIYIFPGLILLTLIIGIVSGIYPAFYLSSVQSAEALKGGSRMQIKGRSPLFGKLLVVFQFSISIFLIISTLVIYEQLEYFQNKNLGFDKEQVLVVRNTNLLGSQWSVFKEKLHQHQDVISASGTSYLPGGDFNRISCRVEGISEPEVLNIYICDHDFLETLKLEIVEGRFFSRDFTSDSSAIVINEETARQYGWTEPLNKEFRFNRRVYRVIGVVKDFHYESLHREIQKLGIRLRIGNSGSIAIRYKTDDLAGLVDYIRDSWEPLSRGFSFEYSFLDKDFENTFKFESMTKKLTLLFSSLAIFISCLGLFGLSVYMAEQRRKEIGIRKSLGASVPGIVTLLSQEYLYLIISALVISVPFGYFFTNKWLQNFAYHIDVEIWMFIMASIIVVLIALASVGYQSLKAASENPVNSLRYE